MGNFECKSWNDLTIDEAIDVDMQIYLAIKRFELMDLQEAVPSIIERLNLEKIYDFYLEMNVSLDIPYHNLHHAHCMILNCYEGSYHGYRDWETR